MHKLLIVDDENDIRQLIARFAEHEGYEVTLAENGAQALDLCRSQGFDAVIMDIMMPGMDGFTAVKEIRELPDKNVPVIMLSALGRKPLSARSERTTQLAERRRTQSSGWI